ncbi:MAG: type II secretion system protein [Phycisphaerae bacterium]|nr:type II secretion system protein [Phycisphaerae bacterium]
MKKAFSLVELLIVISILGIMAAIALPALQDHSKKAKEAAAKDNLRILRTAIELYATQHNEVPPGHADGDVLQPPDALTFAYQLCGVSTSAGQTAAPGTAGFEYGPYLSDMPINPFNGEWGLTMLGKNDSFPAVPAGTLGWYYKAATRETRLDWPGTDSEGVLFYDY